MDVSSQELPAFVERDGALVVVLCDGSPPGEWVDGVAGEFKPASVVFVWSQESKWNASKVKPQGRSTRPTPTSNAPPPSSLRNGN